MNKSIFAIILLGLLLTGSCEEQSDSSVKFVPRFTSKYWGCDSAYDVRIGLSTSMAKCQAGNFFRSSAKMYTQKEVIFGGFYPDITFYFRITKTFNNHCDPTHGVPYEVINYGNFTTKKGQLTIFIFMP